MDLVADNMVELLKQFKYTLLFLLLSIPLGSSNREDTLIWHPNSSGQFSVKSAHHLACNLAARANASSSKTIRPRIWGQIWSLDVQPKIRNFIWRCCQDILPTGTNLARRHCGTNTLCVFCGSPGENMSHALFHYPLSRQIWALSNLRWNIIVEIAANFLEGMSKALDLLEVSDSRRLVAIMWATWNNRNCKRVDGVSKAAHEVLTVALENSHSCRSIDDEEFNGATLGAEIKWKKTPIAGLN